MIAEIVNDMKADFREQPEFAAALVLALAIGVGCNAAVFCMADGDELRLIANGSTSVENQINALRTHACVAESKPGFTVIVGLRQYSVELSVPMPSVRSLFEDARANVANAMRCHQARQVA